MRLVDGATVTLPDTKENQAADPQLNSQQAGLGFPLCRLVALLCLGSGTLLNAATGPCKGKGGDEQTLLRALLDTLKSDDIQWVNTLLGNLKSSIQGSNHGVKFDKYAARYLAEVHYRFNRRFDLPRIIPCLLRSRALMTARPEKWLRLAESWG